MDSFDITTSGADGKPRTMSSLEISDLTGKRHDNVMADIKAMLDGLGMPALTFQGWYKGKNRKDLPLYNLPRRECLILVSGYSVELRSRIIDRWEHLEAVAREAGPAVDLDNPATLKLLLLSNLEKVETLQAQIAADKPKTSFFDQFVNADGLYGLQNAARALGCHPNLFTRWLKTKYTFYQGGVVLARVQYIQMGLFEVKTAIIDDKARARTFITPKGLEYFSTRTPPEIRMAQAA